MRQLIISRNMTIREHDYSRSTSIVLFANCPITVIVRVKLGKHLLTSTYRYIRSSRQSDELNHGNLGLTVAAFC